METTGNFNQRPPKNKLLLNVVIILVVLLVIVLVGYWVFMGSTEEVVTDTEEIEELRTQGESDEISDIEADVDASDFDSLDKELQQIEKELSS